VVHVELIVMTLIYPNSPKRKSPYAYLKIERSTIYWMSQAQNLFDAVQEAFDGAIISREAGKIKSTLIDSVYKYLAGMAIENLLKAIMIRKYRCLVSMHKLDESITRHTTWSYHYSCKHAHEYLQKFTVSPSPLQ